MGGSFMMWERYFFQTKGELVRPRLQGPESLLAHWLPALSTLSFCFVAHIGLGPQVPAPEVGGPCTCGERRLSECCQAWSRLHPPSPGPSPEPELAPFLGNILRNPAAAHWLPSFPLPPACLLEAEAEAASPIIKSHYKKRQSSGSEGTALSSDTGPGPAWTPARTSARPEPWLLRPCRGYSAWLPSAI